MSSTTRPREVERALWLVFFSHAAAMLTMAALLLPMLPGGSTADDHTRVVLIAEHAWRFRLGWFPWQLSALSDLVLAVAMVRARWLRRVPVWIVLAATCVAIVPDQGGQLLWTTHGVQLAREAVASGSDAKHLAFERPVFVAVSAWAALFYTVAGVAWSVAFARGQVWSAWLTRLSVVLWSLFSLISVGPLLPTPPPLSVLSVGNAVGFVLMELWFVLLLECVMRRLRPEQAHGRAAVWRAPRVRFAALYDLIANSAVAREVCRWLPLLEFRSDITNVLYVSYLVPAELLEPYLPAGLTLQRLGPNEAWAAFTFLSYRHGHFGPVIAGRFRRWFSSPVQSNWRLYVRDPHTNVEGIYFVTNAVTTRLHALGARLMAENMPMHLLADAQVERDASGRVHMRLDPGEGSAPDARATLQLGERTLPDDWAGCFASYDAMLAYLVPQDRSLVTAPWLRETIATEIELNIPLDSCEPLRGEVHSRAAERIVGQHAPLCFWVPRVTLRFREEHRLGWPRSERAR